MQTLRKISNPQGWNPKRAVKNGHNWPIYIYSAQLSEMSVLNSWVIRLIPRRRSSRKLQILLQLEQREHGWAVCSPSASCSECRRIRFRHGDRLFRLIFLNSWSRISNDQSGTSFPINYPITILPFDAMQSEITTGVTYFLKLLRRHNP
jgi:hypothetical protein